MPEGVNAQRFPCGRHFGYESGKFRLPRGLINRNDYLEGAALLQLEFESDYGTIVQCADIIIQKVEPFIVQSCDPQCKHGGVCKNGECVCSKMFTGQYCENQVESSSTFSVFLFIFLVALVVVGIMFL